MENKLLIILFIHFLFACSINKYDADSSLAATVKVSASEEQTSFYVLLSELLNINSDRHYFIDEEGVKHADELKTFKELETIYSNTIQPDLHNNQFSDKQLKLIFFFAFYSDHQNSAAFNEYLSSDLMPIYLTNPSSFLDSLSQLSFLIPSVCSRLNAFFGFEDNTSDKQQFLNKNTPLFKRYLKNHSSQCETTFK